MQRTLRLTLLLSAVLLACMSGCGNSEDSSSTSTLWSERFDVDGVLYLVTWNTESNRIGQREQAVFSTLLLDCLNATQIANLNADRAFVHWRYSNNFWKTKTLSLYLPDGEIVPAKKEMLYFIRDNEIVFEKTYHELGINVSHFSPGRVIPSDYLQPILENLVREHVQPQDSETEEQEDKPHEEQDQTF